MVEIKFIFEGPETKKVADAFALPDPGEGKTVVFFDTADRRLFSGLQAGDKLKAILRARFRPGGKKVKMTVKLRTEGQLDDALLTDAGIDAKREDDFAYDRALMDSYSLNADLKIAGTPDFTDIPSLFNDAQNKLIAKYFGASFPWSQLRIYGPVNEVKEWENLAHAGFEQPLTLELWNLPAANNMMPRQILEVSTRVEVAGWRLAVEKMKTQFDAMNLQLSTTGTKTQIVLQHFAPEIPSDP